MSGNKIGTFILATALLVVSVILNRAFSQDHLHSSDMCEQSLLLNRESEQIRNNDRRLALEKATQALEVAEKYGCDEMGALSHKNIGIIHFFIGEYVDAASHYQKSLALYDALGHRSGIASLYHVIAFLKQNQGNFDDAIGYYHKAAEIRESIGELGGVANTQNNLSMIYFYRGQFGESLRLLHNAIKLYMQIGDTLEVIECYINIAAIYETQGMYSESLQKLDDAMELARKKNDLRLKSIILQNSGTVHYELNNLDAAFDLLTSALLIKIDLEDQSGISNCLSNIGSTLRRQGRIDESNNYFLQALKIDQELGNKLGIATQLAQIAGNLLEKNEPLSAIEYYAQSNAIAAELDARYLMKENFMYLIRAHLAVNEYDAAFNYMRHYISYRDDMTISPEELAGFEPISYLQQFSRSLKGRNISKSLLETLLTLSILINIALIIYLIKRR